MIILISLQKHIFRFANSFVIKITPLVDNFKSKWKYETLFVLNRMLWRNDSYTDEFRNRIFRLSASYLEGLNV